MSFTPQTYTDFGASLTALETRIKAAFDALPVSSSPVVRTSRPSVPAMAANTQADVTVTWATPFADANYTVVATVEDAVSTGVSASIVRQIRSRTATGCVIRISNGSPGQADAEQILHVVAVHD